MVRFEVGFAASFGEREREREGERRKEKGGGLRMERPARWGRVRLILTRWMECSE